ncbi:MAG TPA: HAD-IA family hydrolase [Azospirillaceae bacterium]|nr:HAD-IA family hydrolase [Azospirillaceae bacterium]
MNRVEPLRLVVFDCDGTLVDSQYAIVGAMTEAWRADGLPPPDPASVRRVVGLSLVQAIATLLPDEAPERHARLAGLYRDSYISLRQAGTAVEPLFPGVREALDALDAAGFLLGVATGKGSRGLRHTLSVHGLEGRFVTLQTVDTAPGKPHPGMVLQALGEAGVEARDAVVVGDTTYDMEMARAARVASIGVTWGYHSGDELRASGAGCLVDTFADLPAAVARMLVRTQGSMQGRTTGART